MGASRSLKFTTPPIAFASKSGVSALITSMPESIFDDIKPRFVERSFISVEGS